MSRAVVLGGGGPVGVAWEVGLAAGLEQESVRLLDADFFVGTSVGSLVGAMLAHGRPTAELLATQHVIAAEGAPRGTADGAFGPRCILPNARPLPPRSNFAGVATMRRSER